MSPRAARQGSEDLGALIGQLDPERLRAILEKAAEHHEDVARAIRLAGSRATGDLTQLRVEIDRALRTNRFLGYRESAAWAQQARPVLDAIGEAVGAAPSPELVLLIERAIGHVVKVIQKSDDSHGLLGDLARELLDLHARACDAAATDPIRLARWMVRFRFDDQDFFEVDPVRYAGALGELGLAAYRREVKERIAAGAGDSFAARYAQQRLAILAGDTAALVELLGGDLTETDQFLRVAQAMAELGRDEDVLAWARRGIAQTSGWQAHELYDLAAEVLTRRGDDGEVLRLRQEQFRRRPSSFTYGLLRAAAERCGTWGTVRPAARSVLAEQDLGGLVDVLLSDGEPDAAWQVPGAHPDWDPGPERWLRLAEARATSAPGEALDLYLRLVDLELETTGKAAYRRAVALLQRAARVAKAAERSDDFAQHLARLRQTHRRRPTFIATLDKARLG